MSECRRADGINDKSFVARIVIDDNNFERIRTAVPRTGTDLLAEYSTAGAAARKTSRLPSADNEASCRRRRGRLRARQCTPESSSQMPRFPDRSRCARRQVKSPNAHEVPIRRPFGAERSSRSIEPCELLLYRLAFTCDDRVGHREARLTRKGRGPDAVADGRWAAAEGQPRRRTAARRAIHANEEQETTSRIRTLDLAAHQERRRVGLERTTYTPRSSFACRSKQEVTAVGRKDGHDAVAWTSGLPNDTASRFLRCGYGCQASRRCLEQDDAVATPRRPHAVRCGGGKRANRAPSAATVFTCLRRQMQSHRHR